MAESLIKNKVEEFELLNNQSSNIDMKLGKGWFDTETRIVTILFVIENKDKTSYFGTNILTIPSKYCPLKDETYVSVTVGTSDSLTLPIYGTILTSGVISQLMTSACSRCAGVAKYRI